MDPAVTITPDVAAGPPVTITPDQPGGSDQPGWLDREIPLSSYGNATLSGIQSIGKGLRGAAKGTWDTIVAEPKDDDEKKVATASGVGGLALYRTLRGIGHTAEDATQLVGAIHDINQGPDPLGSYAKAAQDTAGEGAGQALTALATEGVAKGIAKGAASVTRPVATAPVRLAARAAETAANQKLLPLKPILNIMTPADEAEALNFKVPGRDYGLAKPAAETPPVNSGAPLPVRPAPEVLQGQAITRGPQVYQDPAAGLGQVRVEPLPAKAAPTPETPAAASPSATAAPPASPSKPAADLMQQLEDALGGKPLKRGVTLRNQAQASSSAASLPEGFTPVKSSALQGYKYNPATSEFESITTGGQHYIHGDVSPGEVAAFEDASSKGKAWQYIRQNPLVAKVIDGKRIPVLKSQSVAEAGAAAPEAPPASQPPAKTASGRTVVIDPTTNRPEFSDVVSAKTGIPEEDLTDLLTQSLKQVRAQKAARVTP